MFSDSLIFLLGPTAVGKSEVAIELASQIGGEIVSADSMQLYRGMDIGTAKLSLEERCGIPHHLMDVLDIHECCDVSRFREMANMAILEIGKRGARPIIVGGSGLYVRALTQGLFEGPGRNEKIRANLDKLDTEALHERLKNIDPAAAARISLQDRRRMIRAVELFMETGQPISALQSQWKKTETVSSQDAKGKVFHRLIALNRPRTELYRRCDHRVEAMFARGFVDEVMGLMRCGLEDAPTASKAIGYCEVIQHLSGKLALDKTVERVKQRTRNFAKRQLTWFRREPNVEWMDIAGEEKMSRVASRIEVMLDCA